jgi:predicted transcriptional regulator
LTDYVNKFVIGLYSDAIAASSLTLRYGIGESDTVLHKSNLITTIESDLFWRTSMDTKVLTAHVPLPLAQKIDNLAAQLDRPRAWIVKQALAAWVGEEEERHRLTLEGMADVTAGRVVDQADVEAWAVSLATDNPLPVPQR